MIYIYFFIFYFFKILISTIFFAFFSKFCFFFVFRRWWWGWGIKRQKLIRTCHTDQDHIYISSYTYHIHISQVSLGVFLYFLKILIFRGVRKKGGVKEYRMTQNDSLSKMPKRILICAPPSSHVCDLLKKYSDILGKNQKFVAVL